MYPISVKKLSCVEYHYNDELELIYLTASKKKKDQAEVESSSRVVETDDTDVYVPVMSFNDIDLKRIEIIQNTLSKDNYQQPNVILAIVDSNATILYYRMTNGLLDLNHLLAS